MLYCLQGIRAPMHAGLVLMLCLSLCSAQRWSYDDYDLQGGEVETENDSQTDKPAVIPDNTIIRPNPRFGLPSGSSDELIVPGLGIVRGRQGYKYMKGRPINSYFGLKYGVVRPGMGRFQQASVYKHYSNEPIDATEVAPNCPQFPELKRIITAEGHQGNVDDCLTLNIHVPSPYALQSETKRLLPVMVFIHGEMLFDGSAEEAQPEYFMEHDVILVSINYRLAPFGFLSTLTTEMPGNVALADIQLALEWIQQYIRTFGGDPFQVTLFGQAGGATLVHALTLSGKAHGLFHKLILHSGTALNPFYLEQDALATARSFARLARCPRTTKQEVENLHSCFERLSTAELLETMKRHYEENEVRGLSFMGGFKLTVGDALGYLPAHPAALVFNRTVPMIIGVTKDAGSFILTNFYDELSNLRSNNISDYINVVLRHTSQPQHYLIWKNLALREIFSEDDIRTASLPNLVQGLLELTNLILYRGPIIDTIRTTYKKVATYLYCFDYRGEFHRFGHLKNPLPFETDATLSDDNIYLFPYPEEVSKLNVQDRALSRTLVNMWTDFATYGVPSRQHNNWPSVSNGVGPFLRIVNSKTGNLELDYHYGDGISIPILYPDFFGNTTVTSNFTTTTTTTPTPRPYIRNPHYSRNYNSHYQYRPHTTILNGMERA